MFRRTLTIPLLVVAGTVFLAPVDAANGRWEHNCEPHRNRPVARQLFAQWPFPGGAARLHHHLGHHHEGDGAASAATGGAVPGPRRGTDR